MRSILITLFVLLVGCRSIGPSVISPDRYNYNLAMEYGNNQELLLNMVRLRYDEAPMTLKVGNISSSTKLETTSALAGSVPLSTNGLNTGEVASSLNLVWSDNPIISMVPLQDQDYTKQFLTTVSLQDLGLLLDSGWSIPRLFRVTLQRLGDVLNAPSAARPTSSHVPVYKQFMKVVYILRRVQLEEALVIGYHQDKKDQAKELVLYIRKGYHLTAKEQAALRKAGIVLQNNRIVLSDHPGPGRTFVITRSIQGVMNYLSKGLIVPPEDAKKGVLTMTVYDDGKAFDWNKVLMGMMKIHYSDTKPQNSAVSVYYRNRWYFIKDSDSDSKQSLILLSNMTGLIQTSPPGSDRPPGLTRNT